MSNSARAQVPVFGDQQDYALEKVMTLTENHFTRLLMGGEKKSNFTGFSEPP